MMPSIPDALHGRVGSCRYDITLPGERWNLESRKRLKCWKDTPWKFCIDTKKSKNDGLEDVSHFKNGYFGYLVMMVRKQDHRSYRHLPHQQHEHEHHHESSLLSSSSSKHN